MGLVFWSLGTILGLVCYYLAKRIKMMYWFLVSLAKRDKQYVSMHFEVYM